MYCTPRDRTPQIALNTPYNSKWLKICDRTGRNMSFKKISDNYTLKRRLNKLVNRKKYTTLKIK